MKILYILGDYGPNMSANGVCSDNVIKNLIEQGHEVSLLVNDGKNTFSKEKEENICVIRVKPRLALRLFKKGNAVRKEHPKKARFIEYAAKIINKLQLFITAPWWPIISPRTVSRLTKAAVRLHNEKQFDAVVSAYTPIESLLAGFRLKKRFPKIKFLPYFLDSLSGGYGPRYFSKKQIVRHCLKIEKRVFSLADKIIVMKSSRSHHEKYNPEFLDKMAFLDIPSFCNINVKESPPSPLGAPIKFLYAGSIPFSVRDPRDIINVMMQIREENIVCEFAGSIDCPHLFEPLRKRLGNKLILSGQLTHDEIMKKMAEADVFLNIGNKVPTMIPSKIFEYIAYGKPIISTYTFDDEPCIPYLKSYPLALLLDCRSNTDYGEQITEFLKKTSSVRLDSKQLANIYRLNSPAAFNEILTKA